MRTLYIASAILLLSTAIWAQKFEPKFVLTLPDSVHEGQIEWVDVDNDGFLDALVLATAVSTDNLFLLAYKTDTTQGFIFQQAQDLQCVKAHYLLSDLNIDNTIDIVVSGQYEGKGKTVLWQNQGDFTFVADTLSREHGTLLAVGDLDGDARNELVISGADENGVFLKILVRNDLVWTVVHDSLKINASSIHVFDFDNDGRNDIFVSGTDTSLKKPVTALFMNKGDFFFRADAIAPAINGSSVIVDLTPDGRFDILLAGKDELGENATLMLMNNNSGFDSILDSIPPADTTMLFAADFDLNGVADIQNFAINHGGDTVNTILNDEGLFVPLNSKGVRTQRFGDYDRDGDLDLIQLTEATGSLQLMLFADTTSVKNRPPFRPGWTVSSPIFNRYFFYWDKSSDDHTSQNSITYDFSLQAANEEWSLGNFDLINHQRLMVSHGNIGTNNFLLLKSLPPVAMTYWVQAIDNTFHAGPEEGCTLGECAGGVCGSGGHCSPEVAYNEQPVCEDEHLELHAQSTALWFSFKDGFLGESTSLELQPAIQDTVFSFARGAGECGVIAVYLIQPQENFVREEIVSRYICEGKPEVFTADSGWERTEWSSREKGFISTDESIVFSTVIFDTLSVTMTDGSGCGIRKDIALNVSHPVIVVDPEIVQILRGEQVQLNVTEGFSEYLWVPATGLSNTNTSNPVAAPQTTSTYTVTAKDSIGCEAQANVHVIVEGTAFIPNLFTPNNDGTNDVLKIYGIGNATKFMFTIHSREGAVVYETKDVREASSGGWDGTARGNSQASGVYYWKVEGELPSGRPLLLNGKKSGSIVLLR